jgi:hypothetical protein
MLNTMPNVFVNVFQQWTFNDSPWLKSRWFQTVFNCSCCVTDGRMRVWRPKNSLYPKEHPANCPLRWRLSNGLGVYLSWLQAGFSHHTRQPV